MDTGSERTVEIASACIDGCCPKEYVEELVDAGRLFECTARLREIIATLDRETNYCVVPAQSPGIVKREQRHCMGYK